MNVINEKIGENLKNDIYNILEKKYQSLGMGIRISNCSLGEKITLYIEPFNYSKVYGEKFDGMQIIYCSGENEGEYEVSECMAGQDENELHVFFRSKSFKRAFNNFMKGNKRKKALEIWD